MSSNQYRISHSHDFRRQAFVERLETFFAVNCDDCWECRSIFDDTGLRLRSLNTAFGDVEWNVDDTAKCSRREANGHFAQEFLVGILILWYNVLS